VPDHSVTQALLECFGAPLLATTLIPPGEHEALNDPHEIRERYEKHLQAVVDAGACPLQPTTVIDLSGAEALLLRAGRGDPARLGL
jgi:tRNA A37 threonylcarbamoyladenosine synthetase subunit TsaC/SUA5/YrdC